MREDLVVRTMRVPLPVPGRRGAVIEVEIIERPPPGKWRRRLAIALIRLAGRLARMRVRVANDLQ